MCNFFFIFVNFFDNSFHGLFLWKGRIVYNYPLAKEQSDQRFCKDTDEIYPTVQSLATKMAIVNFPKILPLSVGLLICLTHLIICESQAVITLTCDN